jgi:hypothetical protein
VILAFQANMFSIGPKLSRFVTAADIKINVLKRFELQCCLERMFGFVLFVNLINTMSIMGALMK